MGMLSMPLCSRQTQIKVDWLCPQGVRVVLTAWLSTYPLCSCIFSPTNLHSVPCFIPIIWPHGEGSSRETMRETRWQPCLRQRALFWDHQLLTISAIPDSAACAWVGHRRKSVQVSRCHHSGRAGPSECKRDAVLCYAVCISPWCSARIRTFSPTETSLGWLSRYHGWHCVS